MQDLKLIAINNTQGMMSKARFNSHVNTVGNSNPVELLLYIQELNHVIELNELDHLEKERIVRDNHIEEIAKLIEVIHKKSK